MQANHKYNYLSLVVIIVAMIVSSIPAFAGGSIPVDAQDVQSTALETARTYVFTCDDGSEFVARIEDEIAWLFLPAGTLSVQKSATATYRNQEVSLQLNGQDALLEFLGGKSLSCSNNRPQAI